MVSSNEKIKVFVRVRPFMKTEIGKVEVVFTDRFNQGLPHRNLGEPQENKIILLPGQIPYQLDRWLDQTHDFLAT